MTSIPRMGTRLCIQLDILGGIKPDASSLVASSPLDGLIAEVLVKPGVTGYSPRKKGTADDTGGRPFAKGARVVRYEWQGARDPNLWNWIKVTSPTDATAEDVANTALAGGEAGDTREAYRIAASPPYFGIPFETARLIPEAGNSRRRIYASNSQLDPARASPTRPCSGVVSYPATRRLPQDS